MDRPVSGVCSSPVHPHIRGENQSLPEPWQPDLPVHPHIRGENSVPQLLNPCKTGSPPHTWGKSQLVAVKVRGHRFTPTYVGKMLEYCTEDRLNEGSPPHTWGKSSNGMTAPGPMAVHPHIRGENARGQRCANRASGSPPHTWGKCIFSCPEGSSRTVHPHIRGENAERISRPTGQRSVHPHIRGENEIWWQCSALKVGSPPHTWGKCGFQHVREQFQRFTPTYVGKILNLHNYHTARIVFIARFFQLFLK